MTSVCESQLQNELLAGLQLPSSTLTFHAFCTVVECIQFYIQPLITHVSDFTAAMFPCSQISAITTVSPMFP